MYSYQGFEGANAPQDCRPAVSRASFEPDYSSLHYLPRYYAINMKPTQSHMVRHLAMFSTASVFET